MSEASDSLSGTLTVSLTPSEVSVSLDWQHPQAAGPCELELDVQVNQQPILEVTAELTAESGRVVSANSSIDASFEPEKGRLTCTFVQSAHLQSGHEGHVSALIRDKTTGNPVIKWAMLSAGPVPKTRSMQLEASGQV